MILPLALADSAPVSLTSAPEAQRCLVVDDERRLRQVLVRLMESDGFTCIDASNGADALEVLRRMPVTPDIILTALENGGQRTHEALTANI